MNFQNHSCLLPQRTSHTRNLEKEERSWMGKRAGEVRGGGLGGWRKRDGKNQITNRKTNSTNETATNSWARVMTQESDLSWFGPSSPYLCMVYRDGWEKQWEHGGSEREWCYPSRGLSASTAAGRMLAGEGNGGADKVWAPAASIEPTALHLSLEGGWRG